MKPTVRKSERDRGREREKERGKPGEKNDVFCPMVHTTPRGPCGYRRLAFSDLSPKHQPLATS